METSSNLLIAIPLLPLAGAAINLLFGRHAPRGFVHAVAIAAVAAALGVFLIGVVPPLWELYRGWNESGATGQLGGVFQNVYTWIQVGDLKLDLALRVDTLTAVMVFTITFVGLLIHVYSTGYMAEEPRYAAYFGYLNLFTGAMLILVLADNLPVMFIGWEGVGLCSYLLIGFWFEETANANAGRKAFVVNRIGDFAFILGMCLLFYATGTLSFPDLKAEPALSAYQMGFLGGDRIAAAIGILLFIGACGKSAQIPLYVWLPDAMAGPTPVSALIHAATMVTAGIYMVARLSFLYASSTTAMAVVAGVGALTALFAAIMAFAQTDLKKVLAYSTVSQLGFMFVGVGVGAYAAGIFHLFTHAFFKAGLFLGAGSVMHAMSGSGDIRKMGGLRHHLPRTHFAFAVYCAAIAGFPPLAGFFSKDEVLAGAFAAHAEGWPALYGQILWAILSVAAAGTAFYMFRLYYLVFAGECRADAETRAHIHESPPAMTWPLLILAVCTCFIGFLGIPHVHIAPAFEGLIASWLAPAVKSDVAGHLSVGGTLGLMGAATAVAVVAWLLARAVYGQGPSDAVARFTETGFGRTLHRVVYNKFYVDELYELLFVRPFRWLAQVTFEIVDRFVIDLLLVNGSAVVVDVSGRVVRWFQNGQVQRYLVGVILGGALILYFASRPEADFSYQVLGGGSVQFHAELDDGPAGQGAVVDWDFDGDGRSDASAAEASWSFAGPGSYEVTLRMTDGVFKRTRSVTKTVVVGEGTGTPTARTGPGSTGAASAGALAGGADEPRVALGVER